MEERTIKQRVLIFHPALAPYRADFFNELGRNVELRVVFMARNNSNQQFNQHELLRGHTYSVGYLDNHMTFLGRDINFGYDKEIKEFRPDIVICSEFGISLWVTYFSCFRSGKKFKIYTICDDSEAVMRDRRGLRKFVSRFFTKRIDGVICINPNVRKAYLAAGAKSAPFFPIIYPNKEFNDRLISSLPISRYYIDKYSLRGVKCILFVGRLAKVKNLRALIKAFALLIDQYTKPIKLVIVGDGPEKEDLISLTELLGCAKNVIFPGRFEGPELLAWYNINGVFVLPSTYEPFGAVVSEALLAGMPVIVSDRCGSKCLVRPENGLVWDCGDIKMLSSFIKSVLTNFTFDYDNTSVRPSLLPYNFDLLIKELLTDICKTPLNIPKL